MNSNDTYVLTEWGLGLMHLPLLLGCGSWDFLSATLHCSSFFLLLEKRNVCVCGRWWGAGAETVLVVILVVVDGVNWVL